MSYEVFVLKPKDFIKTKATGNLDIEKSREILKEIIETSKNLKDYMICIDIRETIPTLTISDIYELVKTASVYKDVFKDKVAILVRQDYDYDKAYFLELCAQNRSLDVKIFTEYEEAVTWLLSPAD